MTTEPCSLRPDASVHEALRLMEQRQLRRLPVLDPSGRLIGIVSLGDLAAAGTPEAAEALEDISAPAEPDR
jgi:CBS domain-containing protein